ncbi:MAG: UvrB/UvrC motif-containing protein [Lentisphaeria bacterium]|nr:UvrB/UvrC motif-containing protein [Lentisphaeria bacterium]
MGKKQLCDICKINEATIHINEIVGGQKHTLHICKSCAEQKQAENDPLFASLNIPKLIIDLSEKLAAKADGADIPEEQPQAMPESERRCPYCNWTLTQLQSSGKVGCSECYNVFHDVLARAIESMHRGDKHVGRLPGDNALPYMKMMPLEQDAANMSAAAKSASPPPMPTVDPLEELQIRLKQAIKSENYEEAAVLRDKIKALQAESAAE